MIHLIGLTGRKHSGKDTCLKNLSNCDCEFEIVNYSFALPLKAQLKDLFDLTDDQLNDPILKEEVDKRYDKSPRELMQWFGTDCMRKQIDDNFWIKKFIRFYEKEISNSKMGTSKDKVIIVTDVRFNNEATVIRELGGSIVKIQRSDIDTVIPSNKTNQHISETMAIRYDYLIKNNTTVTDLHDRFLSILRYIIRGFVKYTGNRIKY